jgi:hypothetical protein
MSTGRRAGLPGGVSRLAAPAPPVARFLRIAGRGRQAGSFSIVQAAITGLAGGGHRPYSGAGGGLAAGSRAAGQVAVPGRAGLPTVLRCRSAWA